MQKIFLIVTYTFGTLLVILLTAIFLSGSNHIPFPDAMLPMRLDELAQIWLAIGALPLWLVSLVLQRTAFDGKRRMVLLYIPAVVCTIFLLFEFVAILFVLINLQGEP